MLRRRVGLNVNYVAFNVVLGSVEESGIYDSVTLQRLAFKSSHRQLNFMRYEDKQKYNNQY